MNQSAIREAIQLVLAFNNLTISQADSAMTEIMKGDATPAQIGAFLVALRMKGETIDEITGCAHAMKRAVIRVRPQIGSVPLYDTCGTGGDTKGTFNVSTAVAFVLAGMGKKVAKHGNYSVSSKCGSADVLLALGANLNLNASQSAECIEDIGIAFLLAPLFHPAMKYATPVRQEIATRTIFNVLGPISSPANATNQLMGVYEPSLTEPIARVLGQLGSRSACVVHGADGSDELSVSGVNKISFLYDDTVDTFEIDPKDLGFPLADPTEIKGGDAEYNAMIMRDLLNGKIRDAKRDAVVLNVAAALKTEGVDWDNGIEDAKRCIDSKNAIEVLDKFIEKTNSYH